MKASNTDLQLDIRYGQQASLYVSQFLVSAGAEEVTLDCSSGVDVVSDQTVVPVHTRLAMSWGAVERLHSLLQQSLEQRNQASSSVPAPHIRGGAAKLPSFGETTI